MNKQTRTHSLTHRMSLGEMPKASAIVEGPNGLPMPNLARLSWDPSVCFADSGDGDGDPTPPPSDSGKTFTQEDVDRIIAKRLAAKEKEIAKLAAENEKTSKRFEEMNAKFEELSAKYEETNKSDVERELIKAQRAIAKYQDKIKALEEQAAEATKTATEARSTLKQRELESALRSGLLKAKAHTRGLDQAVKILISEGRAEVDDEGRVTLTIGDVPYDDPAEAAERWLQANPHFAEGMLGGSGTPMPGKGGGFMSLEQMDKMSPDALLKAGLEKSPFGG